MKIYIAGKITGLKNYKKVFNKKEKELIKQGYTVMNPSILPCGFTHKEYMRICFSMIYACDYVYMLSNWKQSEGAMMEFEYAKQRDKIIFIESED